MATDYHDYAVLQTNLLAVSDELNAMAASVGAARQVLEYDSDRRKRALALTAAPLLAAGESATAADTMARASDVYRKAMAELAAQYKVAQEINCAWEAKKIQFETNRSLLSAHKTTLANI